jgi:hypothetical protein
MKQTFTLDINNKGPWKFKPGQDQVVTLQDKEGYLLNGQCKIGPKVLETLLWVNFDLSLKETFIFGLKGEVIHSLGDMCLTERRKEFGFTLKGLKAPQWRCANETKWRALSATLPRPGGEIVIELPDEPAPVAKKKKTTRKRRKRRAA